VIGSFFFSHPQGHKSAGGGSVRSTSKPRASSRSRSPPGSSSRRASHGDPHSHSHSQRLRSHSNQRPSQGHSRDQGQGQGQATHSTPGQTGGGRAYAAGDGSPDNFSVQSGGSKRYRDGPGGEKSNFVKRNQMKSDKRMSEKGLEEQIVELSQFLEHDSERFQSQQVRSRMRVSTNSSRSNK
jgi:hypothetical protein